MKTKRSNFRFTETNLHRDWKLPPSASWFEWGIDQGRHLHNRGQILKLTQMDSFMINEVLGAIQQILIEGWNEKDTWSQPRRKSQPFEPFSGSEPKSIRRKKIRIHYRQAAQSRDGKLFSGVSGLIQNWCKSFFKKHLIALIGPANHVSSLVIQSFISSRIVFLDPKLTIPKSWATSMGVSVASVAFLEGNLSRNQQGSQNDSIIMNGSASGGRARRSYRHSRNKNAPQEEDKTRARSMHQGFKDRWSIPCGKGASSSPQKKFMLKVLRHFWSAGDCEAMTIGPNSIRAKRLPELLAEVNCNCDTKMLTPRMQKNNVLLLPLIIASWKMTWSKCDNSNMNKAVETIIPEGWRCKSHKGSEVIKEFPGKTK